MQHTQAMKKNEFSASEPQSESEKSLAAISETALANKVACVTLTILVSVICLAYVIEVVKGNRGIPYVLTMFLLAYLPLISAWVLFRKNRDGVNVKHVLIYGYLLLYTFLLFTAQNDLVFTYAIPILIVVTLFNDIRFTRVIGICVISENIISAILTVTKDNVSAQGIVTVEIQILLLIMSVGFFFAVSKTSFKFEQIKLSKINMEKKKADYLLEQILSVSGHMSENVDSVTTQMNTLNDTVVKNMDAMSEVSTGAAETAEAIQNQLVKTEEIQNHITHVENAFSVISSDMQATTEALSQSRKLISNLRELASTSETAGTDVASALESLREYTDQMNSITELITNVASQTSLLALNASIEAARAGEAGKGFAVVASEISNLAGQTTNATENIVSLIGNFSSQLQVMINTTHKLIESNHEQSASAGKTAETFETISDRVTNINSRSQELNRTVSDLAEANRAIISNIETISAITEEVSAHTSETYLSSERSKEIVQQVNTIVSSLNEDSMALRSTEKNDK